MNCTFQGVHFSSLTVKEAWLSTLDHAQLRLCFILPRLKQLMLNDIIFHPYTESVLKCTMLSNSHRNQLLHIIFWLPSFRFRSLWQRPGFAVMPDVHVAAAFPPLCPNAICCFLSVIGYSYLPLPAGDHECALPNPWLAGRLHRAQRCLVCQLTLSDTHWDISFIWYWPWELRDKLEAKNIWREYIYSQKCTYHFREFLRFLTFSFFLLRGNKNIFKVYSRILRYLQKQFKISYLTLYSFYNFENKIGVNKCLNYF